MDTSNNKTTFGVVCYHLDEIDSTNTFLQKLIKDKKVPEGTIVTARHQTAGKGQRGNVWTDEANLNIAMSLYLCPDFLPVSQQFFLNKMICLGVKEALDTFLNTPIKIKWPNDLYIENEKLGGILIESSSIGKQLNDLIVGIGINVNQVAFPSNLPNPISMKLAVGQGFALEEVLQKIYLSLEHWYDLLKNGNFMLINQTYEKAMYRFGELAFFETNEGKIQGKIIGVDELGRLMIYTVQKETRVFDLKEIRFVL